IRRSAHAIKIGAALPGGSMRRSVVLSLFISAFALIACGPGTPSNHNTDAGPNDGCSGSETRCFGNDFQTCTNGHFQVTQSCANACDATKGCVDCNPAS